MSNVPSITFTYAGITIPSDNDVLTGVMDDINQAFGGGLDPNLSTPQGQLATSMAKAIDDKNAQIGEIYNKINPDYADGRWQDAIGRIYFMTRIPGQGTVLSVSCNGLAGTVIPLGAQIVDGNKNLFTCTTAATIGTSGLVTTEFTCTKLGPAPVPSSITIQKAIPGWDSASVVSGVLGRNVETRQEFEIRRKASVAVNSLGYTGSVQGAVLAVSGVLSCYVAQNNTSAAVTKGGVSLAPHSLYVCASGGNDQAVANAIWLKNSLGCDYNGSTSVTVYDSSIGSDPLPSYVVKFQRPTDVPIYYAVTIETDSSLPSNINGLIAQAIQDALSGADGKKPATIGGTIYASRVYAGINATGANVIAVKIGTVSGSETADTENINIDQIGTFGGVTVTQA